MTASDSSLSIRATLAAAADEGRRLDLGLPRALGWATVELDRAAGELAEALGLAPDAFTPAAGSTVLGAFCRIAHDGAGPGLALAILEPSTEGRLAAALARHGERLMAVWFRSDGDVAIDPVTASDGPFGPERLVQPARAEPWRPFLLAAGPGTIDR